MSKVKSEKNKSPYHYAKPFKINSNEETEGRLTYQKLKEILNNNAEKMEEKLIKISYL